MSGRTVVFEDCYEQTLEVDTLVADLIDERVVVVDRVSIAEIVTFVDANRVALIYEVRARRSTIRHDDVLSRAEVICKVIYT